MTGLGPEAKAFLDAARTGDEPTIADRERVRAAIALRLGVGATVALGIAGGSKLASYVLKLLSSKALIAALGGALVVGMSAWMVWRLPARTPAAREPAPVMTLGILPAGEPAPVMPLAVLATDGPIGDQTSFPSPAVSSAPPSGSSAKRATASVVPLGPPASLPDRSAGDVAAEAHLLGEAQTAMRAGDAGRALALAEDHARRYPKGALGEERDAMRIAALCELGRVAEARDAVDRFLRRAPHSPLAGPVRASCGGDSMTQKRPL